METMESLDDTLCDYCPKTEYGTCSVNTNQYNLCEGYHCDDAYENYKDDFENEMETKMKHNKVIFSGNATIVFWEDNTKTIVKCSDNDSFDSEKGFLIAYYQKHTGNSKKQTSKVLQSLPDRK